jgi:hypothetical protein
MTEKAKRTGLSPEALIRAAVTKAQASIFNTFMRKLENPKEAVISPKRLERIEDLEAELADGTKVRKVPVFKDKKRQGMVEKTLPLSPLDRAKLMKKIEAAKSAHPGRKPSTDIRQEFISILPDYSAKMKWDVEFMIKLGVPEDVLVAAGLKEF